MARPWLVLFALVATAGFVSQVHAGKTANKIEKSNTVTVTFLRFSVVEEFVTKVERLGEDTLDQPRDFVEEMRFLSAGRPYVDLEAMFKIPHPDIVPITDVTKATLLRRIDNAAKWFEDNNKKLLEMYPEQWGGKHRAAELKVGTSILTSSAPVGSTAATGALRSRQDQTSNKDDHTGAAMLPYSTGEMLRDDDVGPAKHPGGLSTGVTTGGPIATAFEPLITASDGTRLTNGDYASTIGSKEVSAGGRIGSKRVTGASPDVERELVGDSIRFVLSREEEELWAELKTAIDAQPQAADREQDFEPREPLPSPLSPREADDNLRVGY